MIRILLLLSFLATTSHIQARESYLEYGDLITIKANYSGYKKAGDLVGIPPLLLAAIHYREADLHKGFYSKKRKTVTKNIGGPFMLDLGPLNDGTEFIRRIRIHERVVYCKYFKNCGGRIPRVSHDFSFAILVAAHHLKLKSKCGFKTEDCMAYAAWGYNGRASWHVDKNGKKTHKRSSYVWADPKNGVNLQMQYKRRDGTVKKYADDRPGVMVIYRELVELKRTGALRVGVN